MSLKEALRFVEALGSEARLREALRRAGRGVEIPEIVALACDAGFDFDADQLQEAFTRDWRIRRTFYSAVEEAQASPEEDRDSPGEGRDSSPKSIS